MDVYFQELGNEGVGDTDLTLFVCTVEESTTNFSMRDCLFANSSAPFPRRAGISKAEPTPPAMEAIPGGVEGV